MENVKPVRSILKRALGRPSKEPVLVATTYKFIDGGKVLAEHRCVVKGNLSRTLARLDDFKERVALVHGLNASCHAEKTLDGTAVTVWHTVKVPREFEKDALGLSRLKKSVRTLENGLLSTLKNYER